MTKESVSIVVTRLSSTPCTGVPSRRLASWTRCVTSVSLRSPSPMGSVRMRSGCQKASSVERTPASRGTPMPRSPPRRSTPSKVSDHAPSPVISARNLRSSSAHTAS